MKSFFPLFFSFATFLFTDSNPNTSDFDFGVATWEILLSFVHLHNENGYAFQHKILFFSCFHHLTSLRFAFGCCLLLFLVYWYIYFGFHRFPHNFPLWTETESRLFHMNWQFAMFQWLKKQFQWQILLWHKKHTIKSTWEIDWANS